MQLSTLQNNTGTNMLTDTFLGYNHNLRIADGEFYYTENLTADLYPVLSVRAKRGRLAAAYNADGGIFAAERLCWINGRTLYYNGSAIKTDLSSSLVGVRRQFAAMGAYIVIFPDKIYFNSAVSPIEVKPLGASYTTVGSTSFTMCDFEGTAINARPQSSAPEDPANGDYWIDTSVTPHVLRVYSEQQDVWASVPTTYVKITSTGIGALFEKGDTVSFSGSTDPALNMDYLIFQKGDNYIVVTNLIDAARSQDEPVTVERRVPDMDYIIENNNRLWGCSSAHHEIYSCKLGDPTNWYTYAGISSDSYAATVGTPGEFTGAATLGGYVLFFKADCLHKVYGTEPSNFRVIKVTCRGVQGGSDRSLAVVNEVLYYLSRDGVCAYDGSLPVNVSYQFGLLKYKNAAAGGINSKYYISMQDTDDVWHMFVYDTDKKMWMHEDNAKAVMFTYLDGDLYYSDGVATHSIKASNGTPETELSWLAETGDIGLEITEQKYISRIVIRAMIPLGSTLCVSTSYDDGDFNPEQRIEGIGDLTSHEIVIIPQRCDHMRLRFNGKGDVKIYSVKKMIKRGSETNGSY